MASNTSASTGRVTTLSKRAQTILTILMILGGPLLLLILLEGIAFVWEKNLARGPYAWELVASRRIDLVYHPSSEGGYTLMKPGSHYVWHGIPVEIDAHGLRDSEAEYEKPPGTFRILNLGDSVSMGWGIQEEDTYGKQLERLLNAQANRAVRYEVINAGVPGWNQSTELAYLQAEGVRYQPDLIILEITLVNDIYGSSASALNDRPALFDWLRAHTYFWPLLSMQYQQIKAHMQGEERIPVLSPPKEPYAYFPQSEEDSTWNGFYSLIARIHEFASNKKIPLVVVLFPIEHQVVDRAFPRLPQTIVIKRAGSEIPVIDLLDAYQEACSNKVGGRCQLEDHYLFADLWMHPNTLGSRIAAEKIFERVGTLLHLQP